MQLHFFDTRWRNLQTFTIFLLGCSSPKYPYPHHLHEFILILGFKLLILFYFFFFFSRLINNASEIFILCSKNKNCLHILKLIQLIDIV